MIDDQLPASSSTVSPSEAASAASEAPISQPPTRTSSPKTKRKAGVLPEDISHKQPVMPSLKGPEMVPSAVSRHEIPTPDSRATSAFLPLPPPPQTVPAHKKLRDATLPSAADANQRLLDVLDRLGLKHHEPNAVLAVILARRAPPTPLVVSRPLEHFLGQLAIRWNLERKQDALCVVLWLAHELVTQMDLGYTELIMRDPETERASLFNTEDLSRSVEFRSQSSIRPI